MRRLSRTFAVLLALLGVACAVDRSGDGELAAGANADGSPAIATGGGSAGTGGSSAALMSSGTAGVLGVAVGNAGAGSGGQVDHEGGASTGSDSGTFEPVDSGTVTIDAIAAAQDAAREVSVVPDCSTHQAGQTFRPNGAASAHCYWARADKSNWQEAIDGCFGQGGHLATITSATENTFVVKLISNLGNDDRIWLGGTDKKGETDSSGGGPYEWTTGEPFVYAPWAMNNPDGNCEETCNGSPCQCQHRVCVDRSGILWDRYEGDQNYSVCESE